MSSPRKPRRRATALPNYEQPYEALFEQTNDAVAILDAEGRYVAANQRAADMIGYAPEELYGKHISEIVAPEERTDLDTRLGSLLAGETVPIYERTLIRKDGSRVAVEVNASLVRDEQGRVAYFQSVARDISARKRDEEALRQIAEGTAGTHGAGFFDAVVRHVAQTMDVHCALVTERSDEDPGRARVRAWWFGNAHAQPVEYAIAGTPTETVYGGEMIFYADDVQKAFPRDLQVAELGARSYFGLPLRDAEENVIGHLAVIDDKPMGDEVRRRAVLRIFASRVASELARLRADKHRAESETRYRALVEQLPAVTYVAMLHEETPALYVSPQIEAVLGFTVDEFCVSPSRWRRQLHPDDRESVLEALERTVREKVPFRREYRIFRKDGSLAWIRDEAVVVFGSDRAPLFLQGIMLDVTVEKRLTEELLNARKLESVGMLAGGIAHDFNNTLMGILGNLSIAKTRLEETHSAYVRVLEAQKAALRAKGLTQQLLTFSKGGAPVRRRTSIEGVIRDTVQFVLSGSNVDGKVVVDEDLWAADVDAGQISQVIENLVLNAVQAMPGGGNVTVSADNAEVEAGSGVPVRPGRFVRIRVRDSGPGIAPAVIDRIFDPYFTTKEHGSGLGLATSYAIVQKHEGHLAVRPAAQTGAEFVMYLPAGGADKDAFADAARRTAVRGRHILVMDDDELVLESIGTMLSSLGHRAVFVTDGEQAVAAYSEAMERGERFDLALLDLTIRGGFGGEETMRRILEVDPDAIGVVSSGYSDSPAMANARTFGFRDHLAKPYQPDELDRVLARLLDS